MLKFKQVLQSQTLHDWTGIFMFFFFFNPIAVSVLWLYSQCSTFVMCKLSKNECKIFLLAGFTLSLTSHIGNTLQNYQVFKIFF